MQQEPENYIETVITKRQMKGMIANIVVPDVSYDYGTADHKCIVRNLAPKVCAPESRILPAYHPYSQHGKPIHTCTF